LARCLAADITHSLACAGKAQISGRLTFGTPSRTKVETMIHFWHLYSQLIFLFIKFFSTDLTYQAPATLSSVPLAGSQGEISLRL
jgi:hypothetical protein